MIGINVIATDTGEKANYVASSLQQQFLNMRRGQPTKLMEPMENIKAHYC
ncbi:hypothetical protein [Virgibacillus proomii]|nr:hypothetical protein [Virgibacillus proomii]MBU5266617.1 hypothetical protein [Virgibacillus proomii]